MSEGFEDRLARSRSSVDAERERAADAQERKDAERREQARQASERAEKLRGEFAEAISYLIRAPRGAKARQAHEHAADRYSRIKRGDWFCLPTPRDEQLVWWYKRDRFKVEFCGWEGGGMYVAPGGAVVFWSALSGRLYLEAKDWDRRPSYATHGTLQTWTLDELIRRGGQTGHSRTDYGWEETAFVGVDATITDLLDKIAETVVHAET